MNIILRELRANLKGLIIWIVCIAVFVVLAGAEFSSFTAASNIDQMMNAFPPAIRNALSIDLVRLDRPEGYVSYTGQYLMVVVVIYAALAGAKMLSKEISKKTSETMLALPVTRRRFLALKFAAAIINCCVLTIATILAIIATFSRFDPDAAFYRGLWLLAGYMLFLQLLFVLAGFFVSVLSRRHKRTGTIIASVTVLAYLVAFISNLGDRYDFLRYVTPFEFFPAIDVMHGNELSPYGFVAAPLLIAIFGVVSFAHVKSKDIY